MLMLANGAPVIAKKLLRDLFVYPADGYLLFIDGNRLFGPAKTVRGVVFAVSAATAGALLMRFDWKLGALVGSAAMLGDLFSSFIKRRLNMPPSSQALGLDQVPEALFPLIACRDWLALGNVDIAIGVGLFFVGEIMLSRILFFLGLRERPY